MYTAHSTHSITSIHSMCIHMVHTVRTACMVQIACIAHARIYNSTGSGPHIWESRELGCEPEVYKQVRGNILNLCRS